MQMQLLNPTARCCCCRPDPDMQALLRRLTCQSRATAPLHRRSSSSSSRRPAGSPGLFFLHGALKSRSQKYSLRPQEKEEEEEKTGGLTIDTFNFAEPSYWDERYAEDPAPLDWYQTYHQLAPLIRKHVPTSGRVLVVGCGNSELSEDMVNDGYEEIINIDLSRVAIDAMQKKYSNVIQLKYIQMDAEDLSCFNDCFFDAVIDKGTLDALMCGKNGIFRIASMLREVSRTLNSGGVFILITHGNMQSRLPDLYRKEYCWTISLYVIPRPGSKKAEDDCSSSYLEPVLQNCDDYQGDMLVSTEEDCHFVYVCRKA